jgi:hypothetical protein
MTLTVEAFRDNPRAPNRTRPLYRKSHHHHHPPHSSELLYSPPSARPMAPSRAACLLCPRASPTTLLVSAQSFRLNSAPRIRAARLCTTSRYSTLQPPSLRVSIDAKAKLPCAGSPAVRRLYSTDAAEAPDAVIERPVAPDHLDEKEKAIFDRLVKALDPTALEVLLFPAKSTPPVGV